MMGGTVVIACRSEDKAMEVNVSEQALLKAYNCHRTTSLSNKGWAAQFESL